MPIEVWVILSCLGLGALSVLYVWLYSTYSYAAKADQVRAMIRREGKRAKGKVLKIERTGFFINEQPEAIVTVEVHPETGSPYTVSIRSVIDMVELSRVEPGREVNVRIHPQVPEMVVLDFE